MTERIGWLVGAAHWPASVALLAAAAVLVGRVRPRRRRRWLALRGLAAARGGRPVGPARVAGAIRRLTAGPGRLWWWPGAPLVAAAGAGVPAFVVGGPVAGFLAMAYAALLARALRQQGLIRWQARERVAALDALCALAADLRAGVPPGAALQASAALQAGGPLRASAALPAGGPLRASAALPARRLAALAGAAVRLAEVTGAPLADLIERIETDARVTDRAATAAAAQAAGARATAWLLTALPAGGVALGYGVGVDPLAVLLRTPAGAACAGTAVLLQAGGLAWADRLTRPTSGARARS